MRVMFSTVVEVSVLALCVAVFWVGIQSYSLQPLPVGQLVATMGGDSTPCYTAGVADPCSNDIPCKELPPEGSGIYYKRVGTKVEQVFCMDLVANHKTGNGKTQCENKTYADCYYVYSCSDPACNNCGPPGTERTVTSVQFSGDPCSVGG